MSSQPRAADLEPISPELVLVSPPDVRDRARELLSPPALWQPTSLSAPTVAGTGRLSFAAFCGTCGLMTLAPLALVVLAH
jgi:hypothetical protein